MKILKHTLVYLLIVLPLELLGMIILPIVLIFISKDAVHLPFLFRWWDNHEYYLRNNGSLDDLDGLSGPKYHRIREGIEGATGLKLLWARYKWLALRNALNYFQYKYLGLTWDDDYTIISKHGENDVDDVNPGTYKVVVKIKGKEYWEHYSYTDVPFTNRTIRIRMGWKIGTVSSKRHGQPIQWTFIPFSCHRKS